MEKQNKKVMLSLISSIVSMFLTMVVSFFLSPYIVKHLGPAANGFTHLANNFINYATLITITLNSMAGRFITIAYHKGDFETCKKYYSSVLIGNFFIILVLFLPALYFVFRLENIINVDNVVVTHVKVLFAFVFANFFVSQINGVFSIVFYVKNSQYISNTINMVRTVANAVGLFVLFSVFAPRLFYSSLVGLVLTGISAPIFFMYKRKLMPEVKFDIKAFRWKHTWQMMSSGIWNTINQCGTILMTGLDLLLSNLFINPVQMGVLSISKTIPGIIGNLGTTVNGNFSPSLTISYATGKQEDILKSLRYAMKCSTVLMSVPMVVLCAYGSDFYSLWVPSMDAKQLTILSFLSCAMWIPLSGPQVLYNVFTTTNKLRMNSITILVTGFVNFVAVFVLLKYTDLGLYAIAGVSSILSLIRNLVVTVPYSAILLKLKWYTFYKDVGISVIVAILMIGIAFLVKLIIVPESWAMLIVSVLVNCVICLGVLFLVIFNKDEKRQAINKIRRR